MIARVTDGGDVPSRAFREARQAVLSDPVGAKLAPECVRICREPDNVWAYIKSRVPELPSYASRRAFLIAEFEPLIGALERFDSSPLDDLVSAEAETLSATSVLAAWEKATERRTSDPDGAITAARTLLESVCKTILDDTRKEYDTGDDLPKLYRKVSTTLKLAPSDHTDEQIKRILGGATSVVEGIGSLRNRQSDAHGQGRTSYRSTPRHAALVVNLAGAIALFLMQTFEERQASDSTDDS
jgi:Abortive infection C-terminus